MISNAVVEAFKGFVPEENIYINEPMKEHTTFRVGGPADCLLEIDNKEQLSAVLHYLSLIGLPYFVLGNGSNLLVGDRGYKGPAAPANQRCFTCSAHLKRRPRATLYIMS